MERTVVKLPPPIWAFAFVMIAAGISYLAGWPKGPGLPIIPLGVIFIVLGLTSMVSAAVLFRCEGTEIDPTSKPPCRIASSSPPDLIRLTRNPMYLGLILVTLGIAFWVGAWPMLLAPIATFATVNWVHIPFEEAKMRRQFGKAFDDYAANVRRWV
jgi:protein-S-isoprenylcysteine O-methyltransferase Ste14